MKPLREYEDREIVTICRNVFGGNDGNLVLEHILDTAGVFNTDQADQTSEQAALRAFGFWILNRCGVNCPENQLYMVKALFEHVPIQSFDEKENDDDISDR